MCGQHLPEFLRIRVCAVHGTAERGGHVRRRGVRLRVQQRLPPVFGFVRVERSRHVVWCWLYRVPHRRARGGKLRRCAMHLAL